MVPFYSALDFWSASQSRIRDKAGCQSALVDRGTPLAAVAHPGTSSAVAVVPPHTSAPLRIPSQHDLSVARSLKVFAVAAR